MRTEPRNRQAAGFTLVEVLVVVFILALMATVVVMSVPEGRSDAEVKAEALALRLSQASHEAIASGEPVAWSLGGGALHRFERQRRGNWVPMAVSLRTLNEQRGATRPVVFRVEHAELAGREAAAPGEADATTFQRQILFSPVGEATPADVFVTDDRNELVVRVDAAGAVEILREEAR